MAGLIQLPVKQAQRKSVIHTGLHIDNHVKSFASQFPDLFSANRHAGIGPCSTDLAEAGCITLLKVLRHSPKLYSGCIVDHGYLSSGESPPGKFLGQRSANQHPLAAVNDNFFINAVNAPVDLRCNIGRIGETESDCIRQRH